jgi:ABC-type multidrug transport system ATPase subunit
MTTVAAEASSLPRSLSVRTAPVEVRVTGVRKRFLVPRPFRDVLRHPFRREYQVALDGVNCEIHTGEFFGFLGANGAGKTTLFKILATFISPDEGTATINGVDVTRDAGEVRSLLTPVVADERSLRWRLSARENLNLYAALYGLPSHRIRARVDEVLQTVGFDPADTRLVDQKLVGRFSSGMRQRLLIGRALIPRPRILLLDEPTRSLDPVSARKLRRFLRDDLCRQVGCTVLLATHSSEEAFELCDRVAIMDHGRVAAVGEPERLSLMIGEERYRLWTRTPAHPALQLAVDRGLAQRVSLVHVDEDGWARVDIVIPGGLERAAQALAYLTQQGVVSARFERIGLSLGELLQEVTERVTGGARG